MNQKLWIGGPLPGMNDMIAAAKGERGMGRGYARMKKKWTNDIALIAKAAGLKPVKRAFFAFGWVEKDRRRNPDNIAASKKLILDGLQLAKVIKNDGWTQVDGWADTFEVGDKPGVHVNIQEIP